MWSDSPDGLSWLDGIGSHPGPVVGSFSSRRLRPVVDSINETWSFLDHHSPLSPEPSSPHHALSHDGADVHRNPMEVYDVEVISAAEIPTSTTTTAPPITPDADQRHLPRPGRSSSFSCLASSKKERASFQGVLSTINDELRARNFRPTLGIHRTHQIHARHRDRDGDDEKSPSSASPPPPSSSPESATLPRRDASSDSGDGNVTVAQISWHLGDLLAAVVENEPSNRGKSHLVEHQMNEWSLGLQEGVLDLQTLLMDVLDHTERSLSISSEDARHDPVPPHDESDSSTTTQDRHQLVAQELKAHISDIFGEDVFNSPAPLYSIPSTLVDQDPLSPIEATIPRSESPSSEDVDDGGDGDDVDDDGGVGSSIEGHRSMATSSVSKPIIDDVLEGDGTRVQRDMRPKDCAVERMSNGALEVADSNEENQVSALLGASPPHDGDGKGKETVDERQDGVDEPQEASDGRASCVVPSRDDRPTSEDAAQFARFMPSPHPPSQFIHRVLEADPRKRKHAPQVLTPFERLQQRASRRDHARVAADALLSARVETELDYLLHLATNDALSLENDEDVDRPTLHKSQSEIFTKSTRDSGLLLSLEREHQRRVSSIAEESGFDGEEVPLEACGSSSNDSKPGTGKKKKGWMRRRKEKKRMRKLMKERKRRQRMATPPAHTLVHQGEGAHAARRFTSTPSSSELLVREAEAAYGTGTSHPHHHHQPQNDHQHHRSRMDPMRGSVLSHTEWFRPPDLALPTRVYHRSGSDVAHMPAHEAFLDLAASHPMLAHARAQRTTLCATDLPDGVIHMVLLHLVRSPRDIACASSVCRQWYICCQSEALWRALCIRRWLEDWSPATAQMAEVLETALDAVPPTRKLHIAPIHRTHRSPPGAPGGAHGRWAVSATRKASSVRPLFIMWKIHYCRRFASPIFAVHQHDRSYSFGTKEHRRSLFFSTSFRRGGKHRCQATVLMIGAKGCGKRALFQRFFDGKSQPSEKVWRGSIRAGPVHFGTRFVRVREKELMWSVWGLGAGAVEQRLQYMASFLAKSGNPVLWFVFDVTNHKSLIEILFFMEKAREIRGDTLMYIVTGNKADMRAYEPPRLAAEAHTLIQAMTHSFLYNAIFCVTSAMTNSPTKGSWVLRRVTSALLSEWEKLEDADGAKR